MKFIMSYSGGKDSALALYRMIEEGNEPVGLLTTINPQQKRSWFHGVQTDCLKAVADSLNIPLIICECEPSKYSESIEDKLKVAKEMGAEVAVFGDIDINEHYEWNKARCDSVGLGCVLPLWQEDREKITNEVIDRGFKAMIKIVKSDILDESFLGETLTLSLLEKIKKTGADVCGENGEYHTFIFDGPIFRYPIQLEKKGVVDFKTHKAVDILMK